MDIYKEATRLNLRFTSNRGDLTVEQLWDLPLTSQTKESLNTVAITVSNNITEVKDFVGNSTGKNAVEELKLEIVKDIIADKKQELADKVQKAKNDTEIAKLEEILSSKEDASKAKMSKKEIQAKINSLKA